MSHKHIFCYLNQQLWKYERIQTILSATSDTENQTTLLTFYVNIFLKNAMNLYEGSFSTEQKCFHDTVAILFCLLHSGLMPFSRITFNLEVYQKGHKMNQYEGMFWLEIWGKEIMVIQEHKNTILSLREKEHMISAISQLTWTQQQRKVNL
jgi:hypothetical protein